MLKLAEIFQNHMLLQRQKPIRIWGMTDCSQKLHVFWNEKEIYMADVEKGSFSFSIPPLEAFENGTLEFAGDSGDTIILYDVDIGEIWIAGGQSNMEFPLEADRNGEKEIQAASDEHFRYYEVGKFSFDGEEKEKLKDASAWNRWFSFGKERASNFSAVSVYFAKKLRKDLGIPVAVVSCCWGGTQAITWIKEEDIRNDSLLSRLIDEYDRNVSKMNLEKYYASDRNVRKHAGNPATLEKISAQLKNEALKPPSGMTRLIAKWYSKTLKAGPHDQNRPGGLFHTMTEKVAGFSCRGVLWYQGESDESRAEIYKFLFEGVILSWRKAWNDNLPFLFAQLAPFEAWQGCTGENFPKIRQQQQLAADAIDNCWMISTMDVGSRYDIHPKDKKPVGERLANLALGKLYGKTLSCESPKADSVRYENGEFCIRFIHTGGNLKAAPNLQELWRVEKDGKNIPCEVRLDGNCVYLKVGKIKYGFYKVLFAYIPYCEMALFGTNGLPALPAVFEKVEISQ